MGNVGYRNRQVIDRRHREGQARHNYHKEQHTQLSHSGQRTILSGHCARSASSPRLRNDEQGKGVTGSEYEG
ncbi:hypothetical protein KTAU_06420 [Thermogemmatispora aurantia]|jgi:hypothetical protein|uniref:Uncharacterized protein n=1 Tax=Thermogemmatispora aurantia TaxID=2045279 RepID=A0A5J4JXI1_9CHLR|nr:hypothetical protein KTAU_06420 [Thermogemmatispora aurantia]